MCGSATTLGIDSSGESTGSGTVSPSGALNFHLISKVTSAKGLGAIDRSVLRPHSVPLTAVHPMGTMRMGEDPTTSVVRSTGEHHQLRGLFVADGSLFPTSIGVPPQISIYAFALHLARHVIERARG